jgi:regulation of enolase protein 1 (concanavalin A-like superfamily)
MGVTGVGGFTMLSRTSTGGQSARTNSGYGTPPGLWVRLVRKGNIVTSFRSTDGSRWMVVSRANLSLGASCYIGLAVYGGTDELSTGVFDNIFITP